MAPEYQYRMGFAAKADELGADVVGEPLTDELPTATGTRQVTTLLPKSFVRVPTHHFSPHLIAVWFLLAVVPRVADIFQQIAKFMAEHKSEVMLCWYRVVHFHFSTAPETNGCSTPVDVDRHGINISFCQRWEHS